MNINSPLTSRLLLMFLILMLFFPQSSSAAEPTETVDGEFGALGDADTHTDPLLLEQSLLPPAMLARQDYQNVYDEALQLLTVATTFRTDELQLGTTVSCRGETGDGLADCLKKNYKNFNGGRLFYRFCASFEPQDVATPTIRMNLSGSCRAWASLTPQERELRVLDSDIVALEHPNDVRNLLIQARNLFGFLALGPATQEIDAGNIRELGRSGVLSATREIANIHLIFGQEFMVDALDYRFGGTEPRAEVIINEEIQQLKFALQQFQQAVDVLVFAFNADFGGPAGAYIGDFFGPNEYNLFTITSQRMIDSLSEVALRYRQLGQDQRAIELYAQAFRDQYIQSLAIAHSAARNDANFLATGGWDLLNNLEHLRARAQTIQNGINPFGFTADYVPLQSYNDMLNITRGGDGQSGLYRDAVEDEEKALSAQRDFDQNRTALNSELLGLRLTYEAKLREICGESPDYFATCEHGLMERNYLSMVGALEEMRLANQELQQIPEQIRIEQEKSAQVINLILANGQQMAAIEYSRGLVNYEQMTDVVIDSFTEETHVGLEYRRTASIGAGFKVPPVSGGIEDSLSLSVGGSWQNTHTSSTQKVINHDALQLGELSSLQSLEQATTQAQIQGTESQAVIKGLLLQQVSRLIQLDLAVNRYNQVAAEHNALVDQYHMWLNLWRSAEENQADNYLNNPAYRIMRDQWTIEASRSFNLAAQYVYLTTKAAEYDLLKPYPAMHNVFKARTTDDLDNYLNLLHTWYNSERSPGALNRFPYRISLACDILHLNDDNLSPDPRLCRLQLPNVRYEQFQNFLQQHWAKDANGVVKGVRFSFATSLLDNNIFSQSIWNNRIAGVNLPTQPHLGNLNGLSLNLYTRQLQDIGQPEIQLTHGGHSTYRTASNQIVYYTPDNARPVGWEASSSTDQKSTVAVILPAINGTSGEPTSAFYNLSVAASNWTLFIDLTSPRNQSLDLSQLEDIEIIMDTTGIALPGSETAAQMDAARLQ